MRAMTVRKVALAIAGTFAAVALMPVAAYGAFGDDFGLAPINGHPQAEQQAPGFVGVDDAFWAGACDVGSAPALGAGIVGGVGNYATTVRVPDLGNYETDVPVSPSPPHCVEWGAPGIVGGGPVLGLPWRRAPAWRLAPDARSGGHPDGTAAFVFAHEAASGVTKGSVDNIYVELPAGFVGDPTAVAKCDSDQFASRPQSCPVQSQVGVMHLELDAAFGGFNLGGFQNERLHPIFNLVPREGYAAELGFGYASGENATAVRISAKARTNGDFGVSAFVGQIPAVLPVRSQEITLWGVPWAAVHDRWRAPLGHEPSSVNGGCTFMAGTSASPIVLIPPVGFTAPGCAQSYDPSWGPIRPFVSNVTECTGGSLSTRLSTDSYQNPGAWASDGSPVGGKVGARNGDPVLPADNSGLGWKSYTAPAPPMTGCEKNPFEPDASYQPTATAPDAPAGLAVDIDLPANDDPPPEVADDPAGALAHWKSDEGLATAQLDKAVVTLPAGMSVNPSVASGLVACSDAQIGLRQPGSPPLFDNGDPFDGQGAVECPAGSVIGTAEATTPVLDEKLTGQMVLGEPKSTNPQSGEMFRMFLVLRNKERGLLAKVYGTAVANPSTGQITATFDNNPRVPVENIKVDVKGGARSALANPLDCGAKTTSSVFTPWTAAHGGGGTAKIVADSFTVTGNCTPGFAPTLVAGMSVNRARANGAFSFRFGRRQGEQYLRGLTAKLPRGLLASVRGVPLCSNAAAAAGSCPAGSKIGTVDAKAGSGEPFVLERKGEVFLTEGYKGGEYGLAVKVRPIAGPFRGAMELSPIVVRQAIHVDRRTAQVTAISDPFPLIHHGVPLRVREVTVLVDRPAFMLNPSDCSTKQIGADLVSDRAATAAAADPFHTAGCFQLAFKPRLGLRLTGRKQIRTGRHPGIRALVRQRGISEAGIGRAEVRLPKTLALDVDNAQALCEFEDGTKPDLENHCPRGSIVGRARAQTPLLNRPLAGNVYFVKNVRIDPDTGNEIRTLPMIIAALRGEIAVNLVGESDVKGGKLVSTFANIPDAPISQFNMNIRGGRNGIVAVTRTRRSLINLCSAGRQVAEADMDGQNGKRHDFNVNMRKPCPRRRTAAQVCRTRTNTKPAMRRCVRRVKANRARAAKRQAAAKRKQAAAQRRNAAHTSSIARDNGAQS